jgi:hypothetical protein
MMMLLAAVYLFTSCVSFRDIEVKDITFDQIDMQGSKIVVAISATIHNPNRSFVISSAEGDINREQQRFATMQLLQPITISSKSEQRYSGQLMLTFSNILVLMQMGADYTSWDMGSFLFSGDMVVKSGSIKKRLQYKEIPLDRLMNTLK